MNCFNVLDVNINDTDETVKKKYFSLLKKYPPEKFPHKFTEIKHAYENLNTEIKRYKHFFLLDIDIKTDINHLEKVIGINNTTTIPKLKDLIKLFDTVE